MREAEYCDNQHQVSAFTVQWGRAALTGNIKLFAGSAPAAFNKYNTT